MHPSRLALGLPFLLLMAAAAPQPAPPIADGFVAHRAVYEIGLAHAREGSGVASAEGRMVFELTGSACAGYTMRQRMVVNITDSDGSPGVLDFRVSTYETGVGDLYRFDSRTIMNDEVLETLGGVATRKGSGVEVALATPKDSKVALAGDTLFPTQHLRAILSAARADKRFLAADIYEGGGEGETADASAAMIGRPLGPSADGLLRTGVTRWPVSVGYFNDREKPEGFGEELPAYQVSFTLYENGVTNDLVMDYGDYALSGRLKTLEPLEPEPCPAPG